uniref:DUF1302 family protein n=1 Tax=Ningiella ruwaisensis TaxID=2364274 RepID=UPI001F50119E|nr:DUF1302 family protein [Ningiella ruwaisensis]
MSLTLFILSMPIFAQDDEWDMGDWEEETTQDYRISGFFEVAAGLRISDDPLISKDMSLGELRAQFQFDYDLSASRLSLNADAYYDGVLDQTKIQVREAAWQGSLANIIPFGEHFDLKIGQQVLTWGTGDYVFLNDLFPKDFQSFFAGRDDEYLKAPSLSAKLSGFFDLVNIDVVITPEFTPDNYINGDYFSFFSPVAGQQVAPGFDVAGERLPDSPEYALRLFKSVQGTEYALYAYDGYHKTPNSLSETFLPSFSKLRVYGASLRTTLGKGLVNAEYAYYDSREDKNGNDPLIPNSQSRWLIGYEQELVKNLTGSLQWYLERTEDYSSLIDNSLAPEYEVARSRVWLTQRLSYRAMQQTLTLNAFNFYSSSDGDGYLKLNADYSPVDEWRLSAGLNFFYGDEPWTFFNQFEDASNMYLRFRYFY